MKFKKLVLMFALLLVLPISYAQVGCCINPGAGISTCSFNLISVASCCPIPEASNQGYYKGTQNPNGPQNSNDCRTNFFQQDADCSTATQCGLGCCCSDLGGSITPRAQCTGTSTFTLGSTSCNTVCPTPQCNDGIDNDRNGCLDFSNGDLGCTSAADRDESGGSCSAQGAGCVDPSYAPKLSSLVINPVAGQKKILVDVER